jgi:hypothetical protein
MPVTKRGLQVGATVLLTASLLVEAVGAQGARAADPAPHAMPAALGATVSTGGRPADLETARRSKHSRESPVNRHPPRASQRMPPPRDVGAVLALAPSLASLRLAQARSSDLPYVPQNVYSTRLGLCPQARRVSVGLA